MLRTRWVDLHITLLCQVCDAVVVMELPMPRFYLLSIGVNQALLPPNFVACKTTLLRVGRVAETRRLWLVGRVRALTIFVEGGLTVATFVVLERYASRAGSGVRERRRTIVQRGLGLVRGSRRLWGSCGAWRTLSSGVHRRGGWSGSEVSTHARKRCCMRRSRAKEREGMQQSATGPMRRGRDKLKTFQMAF